jgi:hypothetical protein
MLAGFMSLNDLKSTIAEFLQCDNVVSDIYLQILSKPTEKTVLLGTYCNVDSLNRCLELLLSLCLITNHSGRDKVQLYYAIDPQFAFPAIILSEMWKVNVDLHTINELLERKDYPELNARYKKCQVIVKNAKALYKKQLPFLKEVAVVVSGYKRIASCISELLETANTDIYAVLSPPHLLGEIVWHTVVEKMKQGIVYNRITTFDELIRHGYHIYSNEVLNYNETLFICRNNALAEKFYVVNNVTVAFFSPDARNKDFLFRVQIMNNAEIARRRIDVYEKLRNESINLMDLLNKITPFRNHFLSIASRFLVEGELEWLRKVFDYGVFQKQNEYDQRFLNSVKEKCLEHGFITITSKNEILANYTFQGVMEYAV